MGSSEKAVKKKTRDDFDVLDLLGEGSFSSVFLCIEKQTDQKYAMKMLDKKQIIKENRVKYVHSEKEILSKLDHPFVIKLSCTFQDPASLCKCDLLMRQDVNDEDPKIC